MAVTSHAARVDSSTLRYHPLCLLFTLLAVVPRAEAHESSSANSKAGATLQAGDDSSRSQRFIRREADELGKLRHGMWKVGTNANASRGKKTDEFCHFTERNCIMNKMDCVDCDLTPPVLTTSLSHGDMCVSVCGGNTKARPCPEFMWCDTRGEYSKFEPRGSFQCTDMTNTCCMPYVAHAPWPPCEEATDGLVAHGFECTTKCNEGYSPSVDKVTCNAGGTSIDGGTLEPTMFRCEENQALSQTG